ncbi:hypothetical protein AS032_20910 [Rhodococcus qingshengii]|nr:hypothetical protein AS032_20910 [Rhodococcus qingshengii]
MHSSESFDPRGANFEENFKINRRKLVIDSIAMTLKILFYDHLSEPMRVEIICGPSTVHASAKDK